LLMNKREKILASVVGAIIVVFLGQVAVRSIFLGRLKEKNDLIAAMDEDIAKKKRVLEARNRLVRSWRSVSQKALSDDPDIANRLLLERVTTLTTEAQLADVSRQPVQIMPEKQGQTTLYYKVAVNLTGKGTLAQIVKFLEMFYQEPYIVKITGFSLKPEGSGQMMMFSNCRIETIVPAKPELDGIPPVTSRPTITGSNPPVKSQANSRYTMIVDRNIFNVKAPEPPRAIVKDVPPPPRDTGFEAAQVVGPVDPNGRPGDIVGTTVLGSQAGVYVRNPGGVKWYKVSDQLENQMTVTFVHPLGIILKDPLGRTLYVEIGRNIDQAAPLTREVLPELFEAYENHKKP